MEIYYDIETVAKESDELEELMPSDIKNPKMPWDLEHVQIPDFQTMVHGNLKDPQKIQEWRDKKAAEFHSEHKAKIEKWNAKCMEDRMKFIDGAALSAGLCRIKLVGFRKDEFSTIFISEPCHWSDQEQEALDDLAKELEVYPCADEKDMLSCAWTFMDKQTEDDIVARFVGIHSNRFDLPMMKRRSWVNRVHIPLPTMRGSYANPELFCDLNEVWASGDKGVYDGMSKIAQALGIEAEKSGSGERFGELWKRDRIAAILYNNQDLIITEKIGEVLL